MKASTQVRPGESVLIHGAARGGGSFAVQVANALGAGKVIARGNMTINIGFFRHCCKPRGGDA
jgi:NADPH2:quinone reductase